MTMPVRTFVGVTAFVAATLLVASPARADLPVSCTNFTDSPLVVGTLIKAVHLTQLRTCVNDLRAQKSVGAASWTDPVIVTQVTVVKAVHITELRTALNQVYAAGGQPPPNYSATPIAGVTTIAATYVNELRSAAQTAPLGPCHVDLSHEAFPGTGSASGGTGSVAVTASCSWTAVPSHSWLTVTPASESGNDTVQFTFAANTSGPRTGYIDIGTERFTVTQAGSGTTGELIVNGHFEGGFVNATAPVLGRVAVGWSPSADALLLDEDGVPADRAQFAESGGIFQWVTMPPNQIYLLTADVHVHGGSVTVYMDKAGGGLPTSRTMTNGGGRRVQLLFWHQESSPTNVVVQLASPGGDNGTEFFVDDVSLRPLAEVNANERIVNGGFNTFAYYNDGQSAGDLGTSWTRFGTSSSVVTYSQEDSFNPAQQFVQYANAGDGIGQHVSVVPGQRYHLRASITGWAGSAKLGIGPVGWPATHAVGWCGGGGVAHTLSMIYTPPAGQTGVTVSVAGDWAPGNAAFYVDDVSLMPTTLTFVDPGAAQGACVPRHTLTFEVHDAVTQASVEGALVQITPSWGSGPPRVTYPDGTMSYEVGDGTLNYSISRSGYMTMLGSLDSTGLGTWAVALFPTGSVGPISITPANVSVGPSAVSRTIQVDAPSSYSWSAVSTSPFLTVTQNATGTGSGVVQYSVATNGPDGRTGQIIIEGLTHTVTQSGSGDPVIPCSSPSASNSQFGIVTGIFDSTHETKVARLGVGAIRLSLYWDEVETHQKGGLDWSRFDAMVEAATCRGLEIFLSVSRTPQWAGPRHYRLPTNMSDWYDFMRLVIERFGDHSNITFGVWNEPNLDRFLDVDDDEDNDSDPDAALFAALWEGAVAARASQNPSVRLAGPETSWHALKGSGSARYFARAMDRMRPTMQPQDVVTVHYYDDADWPLATYMVDVRDITATGHEIWLTEAGVDSADDAAQSWRLRTRILSPFVDRSIQNFTKIFVYQLHDHAHHFLVNDDWSDRPSFDDYKSYINTSTYFLMNLQAQSGYYVTDLPDGAGLRADVVSPGPGESLALIDHNGGWLMHGDAVSIVTPSFGVVNAVSGGGGAITSDSNGFRQYQVFLVYRPDDGSGQVRVGDAVAFRSLRGHWVTVGGGGDLDATGSPGLRWWTIDASGKFVIRY